MMPHSPAGKASLPVVMSSANRPGVPCATDTRIPSCARHWRPHRTSRSLCWLIGSAAIQQNVRSADLARERPQHNKDRPVAAVVQEGPIGRSPRDHVIVDTVEVNQRHSVDDPVRGSVTFGRRRVAPICAGIGPGSYGVSVPKSNGVRSQPLVGRVSRELVPHACTTRLCGRQLHVVSVEIGWPTPIGSALNAKGGLSASLFLR